MRMIVIAGALSMAMAVLMDVRPSQAEGSWCLYDHSGNKLDCSFVSQRQCLETARGTAARCNPNPAAQWRRRGF